MTVKEVYEFFKEKDAENAEIIIRLQINDTEVDFCIDEDSTGSLWVRWSGQAMIEPSALTL